jgi:hypothetical protein
VLRAALRQAAQQIRLWQQTGYFRLLSGPLDLGRKGERRVMKVVLNKLREHGADVYVENDARDDFGEDGILVVDSYRTPVQIVTVPNNAAICSLRSLVAGERGRYAC